jgi:steroid delta-isomerase-like uncharacterized protein
MPTEQNKALVRKSYELMSQKNIDGALSLCSPNFVDHALRPGMGQGIEGTRQFFHMQFTAFPDMQATLEDIIAEGDKVVTRMTLRGTNTGPFMGMPPTGKSATWSFIDIFRIADGKLAEHWVEMDSGVLMQQLGLVPPPPR